MNFLSGIDRPLEVEIEWISCIVYRLYNSWIISVVITYWVEAPQPVVKSVVTQWFRPHLYFFGEAARHYGSSQYWSSAPVNRYLPKYKSRLKHGTIANPLPFVNYPQGCAEEKQHFLMTVEAWKHSWFCFFFACFRMKLNAFWSFVEACVL